MQYNQPYGVSDPNAGYINGNPSTGTMGSIPPAASIEYPQREIVNFETDSGLTPSNTDLRQLSKSVQVGKVNYVQDAGTPNFIAITPTPAVAALSPGLHFRVKLAATNTGPTKIDVSGLGFLPLVHSSDQSDLGSGEISVNQIIEITWDGTHWQLLSGGGGAGGSSGAIIMTGPKVLYVNGTTGSDTLYDGSQATVDATNTHGPFKTLQKAQNATTLYNLNGYNITINVAAGTYGPVQCGAINGSGIIYYVGNPSNPASVVVQNNIGPCFQFTAKGYSVDGFTVTSTGHSPGVTGAGIYVLGGGGVAINTINFGYCIDQHIALDGAGTAGYFGPITISGGTVSHILSINSSFIRCGLYATPVNITAAMTISTYIYVLGNAGVQVFCTFTGYANVTAGSKFAASANGVINTGGAGVNHFPGPTAGTLATGGQYV